MLLTSSLLQRVCNNFMVIEVWNRIASQDHGDQVKWEENKQYLLFVCDMCVCIHLCCMLVIVNPTNAKTIILLFNDNSVHLSETSLQILWKTKIGNVQR